MRNPHDSLIENIPTFDGKPELHFKWILKLENISTVTKQNPKELALVKAQGTVIKCLKSLPVDTSRNNVKAILKQQFSLLPPVTHAAIQIVPRYKQQAESLQEFNFEFSELIYAVSNCEPRDIIDPLKIYKYAQKLFYPPIISKTISQAHPTL